ncbi:MAG TPA: hypothetical protein VG142_00940 [Trebonia sp.]|nr:hypothetical protein [Trebonia sp.]
MGSAGGIASLISYPVLLLTPAGIFGRIVPFLVAFAALSLLSQPRISAWLDGRPGSGGRFWTQYGLFAVWIFDGYWASERA